MADRSQVWLCAAEFYRNRLRDDFAAVRINGQTVSEKYGLSTTTCYNYFVGFAPADVSLFEILKSELNVNQDDALANNGWGLLNLFTDNGFKAYNFYQGRLVFAYPRGSQIEYFSGRLTDLTKDYFPDRKFLHMNTKLAGLTELPLFLQPASNGGPTILVEQPAGALRLRQEGFAGIAASGSPSDTIKKFLRHVPNVFFWPDVDQVVAKPESWKTGKNDERVYVPPVTKCHQLRRLWEHCRDMDARLVRYDDEFCSKFDKGDQNDWWLNGGTPERFLQHLNAAVDHWTLSVISIDPGATPAERYPLVKETVKFLIGKPPAIVDETFALLKKHLGLSADAIKSLRKDIQEERKDRVVEANIPDAADFSKVTDFRELRAGMARIDDTLYFTVYKPVEITEKEATRVEFLPYIVSSKREIFSAQPKDLTVKKLYMDAETTLQAPANKSQLWSPNPMDEWSIPQFLGDPLGTMPDTKTLFSDIREFITTYAYFDNDATYDYLTTYIACTYCPELFEAMGFINLVGERSSGKTRILEIFKALAWDPESTSQSSDSWVFRATDSRHCTILIDEAEFLATMTMKNGMPNEKNQMLNAAYKKDGSVGRSVGENLRSKSFRTFGCYVIAGTKELNPTLATRSIVTVMRKRPLNKTFPHWFEYRYDAAARSIRNRLHYWILANAENLFARYNELMNGEFDELTASFGLKDREVEIWTPCLTIARVVDQHFYGTIWSPEGDDKYPPVHSMFFRVLTAAQFHTEIKSAQLSEQEVLSKLLIGLRQMMKEGYVQKHAPGDKVRTAPIPQDVLNDSVDRDINWGWYRVTEVQEFLWKLVGLGGDFKYPKPSGTNSLKPLLSKLGVMKAGTKEEVKLNFPTPDEVRWVQGGAKCSFIRLFLSRIENACKERLVSPDAELDFLPGENATKQDRQEHLEELPPLENYESQNTPF